MISKETCLEDRLLKCFERVFPNIPKYKILETNASSVGEWDSVHMVKLMMVIEEEFNTEIDSGAFEYLVSFQSILEYLDRNLEL